MVLNQKYLLDSKNSLRRGKTDTGQTGHIHMLKLVWCFDFSFKPNFSEDLTGSLNVLTSNQ